MVTTLFLTVLIEGIVASAYARGRGKPAGRILLASIPANLLTQTLLWLALISFPAEYPAVLFVSEALIWLTESALLRLFPGTRLSWGEALKLSLWMNLISFGIGLFLPV